MKRVILNIIVITLVLTIVLSNISFAGNAFDSYKNISASNSEVKAIAEKVIGIINVVGVVIAISMLLFVGMKFMMAAPDEKANLKGTLTIYIVGAAIFFASTAIASFIYKISKRI